jgi:hypothetical protein
MSILSIKQHLFPWLDHRTLAEVLETEELRRRATSTQGLPTELWPRLEALTRKERAYNTGIDK